MKIRIHRGIVTNSENVSTIITSLHFFELLFDYAYTYQSPDYPSIGVYDMERGWVWNVQGECSG